MLPGRHHPASSASESSRQRSHHRRHPQRADRVKHRSSAAACTYAAQRHIALPDRQAVGDRQPHTYHTPARDGQCGRSELLPLPAREQGQHQLEHAVSSWRETLNHTDAQVRLAAEVWARGDQLALHDVHWTAVHPGVPHQPDARGRAEGVVRRGGPEVWHPKGNQGQV